MVAVPDYMRSTYTMIVCAYESEIPDQDYYPLIHVLREADMSYRSIAHVISLAKGGNPDDYLYDVGHLMPTMTIERQDVNRVIQKLNPCGYDSWRVEE